MTAADAKRRPCGGGGTPRDLAVGPVTTDGTAPLRRYAVRPTGRDVAIFPATVADTPDDAHTFAERLIDAGASSATITLEQAVPA